MGRGRHSEGARFQRATEESRSKYQRVPDRSYGDPSLALRMTRRVEPVRHAREVGHPRFSRPFGTVCRVARPHPQHFVLGYCHAVPLGRPATVKLRLTVAAAPKLGGTIGACDGDPDSGVLANGLAPDFAYSSPWRGPTASFQVASSAPGTIGKRTNGTVRSALRTALCGLTGARNGGWAWSVTGGSRSVWTCVLS